MKKQQIWFNKHVKLSDSREQISICSASQNLVPEIQKSARLSQRCGTLLDSIVFIACGVKVSIHQIQTENKGLPSDGGPYGSF
jgi:hypothetical protein